MHCGGVAVAACDKPASVFLFVLVCPSPKSLPDLAGGDGSHASGGSEFAGREIVCSTTLEGRFVRKDKLLPLFLPRQLVPL